MGGAALFGLNALINICLSLVCIVVCWWVLMGIRIEMVMRVKRTAQAKALMIILSIILGHQLATFLIDYLSWSRSISQLFT
ncbi:DUF1146 family protein [Paenactinomyces guangxiensis]|uniref:DUF1146 domain-containing protein n=1 Tax=Paenactinomyces guangxiensis TaxID=1490290 RepID=A0A7W1WTZ4_9BACL|nr:DUF1146 family protein [Paenactinomyces guangxiensis]MBA4495974.1 DUF1146 domain-containing protein [Paenactinomyces guangxiensis]MBH8593039.1 DUF1146 domain-containing protein [Paenactinomyces guangxiensis]